MANRNRVLRRLYAWSRYGLPFAILPPRSAVARFRSLRMRERFRSRHWFSRFLLYGFTALSWPVAALGEVRTNARLLERRSLWSCLPMLRLALLRNVPPVEYAAYGFEDKARRRLWPKYLYWTDTDALKSLNRLRGAQNDDVQDKSRFALVCRSHGLAHVPTLAESRAGQLTLAVPLKAFPCADLWLKPTHLQGGVGAELWRNAEGIYTGPGGVVLSLEQLAAHLGARGGLLQLRLRNHADVEPFTNGSLASLRIVTACHRSGSVSLLGNFLALPQGNATTTTGGMVCRVEWEKGVVDQVLYAQQAELGAAALGLPLPFWKESLDLVSRAHRTAFPRFATLGWDVALTPGGPVLLEANSGWGALALQQLWGPLGLTPFSALLEEELAAAG